MDVVGKRRVGARSSVVAGSVWESRMKLDEVRGGIKVFNGEESSEEGNGVVVVAATTTPTGTTKSRRAHSGVVNRGPVSTTTTSGKRKTWKSESSEGFERNPIQIARGKTEPHKNSEEQSKELSVSGDGIKRSPVQARRLRSELNKEIEKSPIGMMRRSMPESLKEGRESGERIERNSIPLRKAKSDSVPVHDDVDHGDSENRDGIGLTKSNSEPNKVWEVESIDGSVEEIEKIPLESENNGSDEACKEFDVCQEKVISSNVEELNSDPKALVNDDNGDDEGDGKEEEDEVVVDEGIEVEVEKKSLDIEEIKTPEPKPSKVIINGGGEKVVSEVKKVHFERREVKKVHQIHQKQKQPEPVSLNVKKQPPLIKRATVHSSFSKGSAKSPPFAAASNEYHSFPETHSRLQSFVDLIMWKEISRSVFIFGIGTFIILSSSYTKDLSISFISVISYLGLVYLAAIFLLRSIVCRGVIDIDYTSYVLGEEEAIWLLKLVLPYLNEFLLKLKALFSGDPSTTMKLAVLLFVLARCGSSITIWTMAKLGFFGVFTVPKVCSLYSAQITAYAKFWVRRFRDAWDSCSHKKAVTVAVFLLVWNLSSIVARIWAVFMLYVAFRYYQQTLVRDDWVEGVEGEETWYEPIGEQRQGHGPTIVDNTKQKKRS